MSQQNNYQVTLSTCTGLHFFNSEKIIRMEARSNYTSIYFTDHKPILVARILKDYEEMLHAYGFVRTHRSHLVNRKYISYVDLKGNIMMQDFSKAEISRRRKGAIMRVLKTGF